MYEFVDGADIYDKSMKMNHYAFDVVQRFYNDKFWAAARYENAVVKYADAFNDFGDAELTQYQLGLGWFLSKNAVAKLEYIDQKRENFSIYKNGDAEFKGFMVNASLSF
jgi:phosphate-selective porin